MMDLITEHIDVWTSAQVQKKNGGRGRGKKTNGQSIYGIKKLRDLILELAVRGRLVPQDPDDESASVLLERIATEKTRLIKEGKIKKQKKLPEIKAEEMLFQQPAGWSFKRLGDFTIVGTGSTPSRTNLDYWSPADINWVTSGETAQEFVMETKEKVSALAIRETNVSVYPVGTLIVAMYGQGKTRGQITELLIEAGTNQACAAIRPVEKDEWHRLYIKLFFKKAYEELRSHAAGGAQPNLNVGKISSTIIPLPPLAEQHRIVAKVDELMALCDKLEQQQTDSNATHQTLVETLLSALTNAADQTEFTDTWQRIADHFDTLLTTEKSIDHLKQTILQLAVMGKLVPQDPEDEPASDLLEKIAEEKEQLIKEGKIKKQKKLPPVESGSAPFDLPSGWAWARFPELGEFGRGKSKHRPRNDPSLYTDGAFPLVQTGDVARANGTVETYSSLYNEVGLSQSKLWPQGTMCITIAANIADSSILGFDACFPDSVVGLIVSAEIGNATYFEYFMRTAKERLMDYAPSTAQKNINLGILEKVYIPLPPANEIERIVSKVDNLMSLCDTIKNRISDTQTIQVQLADTIVNQATN
jgi:type I restriction enzyme S subunit